MMTGRERILKAVRHEQPDKIPIDFGGTMVTGMHVLCVEKLRDFFGLEKRLVKVCDPYQMLGELEEDLLDALHVDTVMLPPPSTLFGFPNENWKEFTAPWGQKLLVSEHFRTTQDTNGDLLIYPGGDLSAPPSGRMPRDGYFFDTIIRQEPIDEDHLDPEDNLEEFGPISDSDVEYYAREAERLAATGRAVCTSVAGTALGDIALVPAPFLKHPKGIRDVAEWYMSTTIRRDYVHQVFDRQTKIALKNLEKLYESVGDRMDVLFVCGTDFGTQNSQFCSTKTFEELWAPYYKRINGWVRENTAWKTFKHCCGAAEPFMSLFSDCGFDIVNPVQCSAANMDPRHLKDSYGDRLTFWGGGVDTQRTLPFGTPAEVRREVLERCEIFAPGGGFVFNTIHNALANSPLENLVAMVDAVKEFNGDR